jgi:adenosylhomocysteine nucleosidase
LSATGVVAALDFEARCLGTRQRRPGGLSNLSDGSLVSVSGIGADNAARAARTLVAAGADALLSFGVAGALDPALSCATAVLPGAVLRRSEGPGSCALLRYETCRPWRERLVNALQGQARVVTGTLLSTATPVAVAALKAQLFHETHALAVDMESAAVAEVAANHGLPFIALRVILDTAADSLPESVLRAFDPAAAARSGLARVWRLLWLLKLASDLRPLLRLAAQYRLARRALRDCVRFGDPTRLTDLPGEC